MSLESELRQTLSANLFDVAHLPSKEVIKLAEATCSLEHNPEFYFKQALAIVERNNSVTPEELKQADGEGGDGSVTSEELTLAAKFIEMGQAEQEADIAQAKIGQVLGRIYRDGDGELGIAPDLRKAGKYGRSPDALPASKKSTEFAYKFFLWFTRVRLFLVRADRIFKDFNHPILAFPWLSKSAALGGLSYFGEFLVDCAILFKAAFFPTKEQRAKTPGLWNRVKNTFFKGDRIYRMANVRWGIGNLLSFLGCFIPPITAAMNLVLFVSDLVEDHIKYKRTQKNPQVLLTEIAAQKEKLKLEISSLAKLEKNLHQTMKAAILGLREYKHIDATIKDVQKQLHQKRQQLNFETSVETKLIKQREADLQKRKRLRYVSGAILVGMALLLVPQIIAPAFTAAILTALTVKIIAACIAMSGSVAGGLVRGVYDEYKSSKYSKYRKPEIEIKVSDRPQLRMYKTFQEKSLPAVELANTPQKISDAAREGLKKSHFYKGEFSKSAPLITGKILKKPNSLPKIVNAPVLSTPAPAAQPPATQPINIPVKKVVPRGPGFFVGSNSKVECLPDEYQSGVSFVDNSGSFGSPPAPPLIMVH